MERKGRDRHGGGRAPTWRKRTPRRTPRKHIASSVREGSMARERVSGGARGAPFEFQKRIARIDWRTLHTIDVDRVIREVGNVTQPPDVVCTPEAQSVDGVAEQCRIAVLVLLISLAYFTRFSVRVRVRIQRALRQ